MVKYIGDSYEQVELCLTSLALDNCIDDSTSDVKFEGMCDDHRLSPKLQNRLSFSLQRYFTDYNYTVYRLITSADLISNFIETLRYFHSYFGFSSILSRGSFVPNRLIGCYRFSSSKQFFCTPLCMILLAGYMRE